ncbi:hypothetical protein WN48_00338 [Eufriesea mexicana]|uniref:Uncharacterized protein n=1 Tax=Eufriesea mexicana TaxID=516756 RepID=A0A310SH49_9HYME|nr:hypothetical protein WN48_00338 [Eufriesea mexicana]
MKNIDNMEKEELAVVLETKYKLNIECECCFKAKICRNTHRKLETTKTAAGRYGKEINLSRSRKVLMYSDNGGEFMGKTSRFGYIKGNKT